MSARTEMLESVGRHTSGNVTSLGSQMAKSVLTALGDAFSEKIVACTVDRARTVEEISNMEGIPLSTCYRRIRGLLDSGLLVIERIIITGSGNRYATYRSSFKSYHVSIDAHGLDVQAELNEDVAEKYRSRQLTIAHADRFTGAA